MKIFGEFLKIKSFDNRTEIHWKRLGFDILFWIAIPMFGVFGIGSMMNLEELWGTELLRFNLTGAIIYWSMWLVMTLHVFFNRKSKLIITENDFSFRKRPFSWKAHRHPIKKINHFDLVLQKNYHENDIGFYPDIYNFFICLTNGKRIKNRKF